jgi:hypothetical protein
MPKKKELEIVIETDGTLSIDQIGWEGKACDGAIDDMLKSLGKVTDKKKKADYHKKVKVDTKLKQCR